MVEKAKLSSLHLLRGLKEAKPGDQPGKLERTKKFLKTRQGLAAAGAAVVLVASGVTAGLAATSGGTQEISTPSGHSQLYERDNPAIQAQVGEALKQLQVRDTERLIVNPDLASHLASFAVSAAEKTFLAKVNPEEAGVPIKEHVKEQLATLSQMTPEELLDHSYTFVNRVADGSLLFTTRFSADGNILNTVATPALEITYSNDASNVELSTYIDPAEGLVPDNASGRQIFPLQANISDNRQTAKIVLSNIVGDHVSSNYSTTQADADGLGTPASVTVSADYDTLSLDEQGQLSDSRSDSVPQGISSYDVVTRASNKRELEAQILFAAVRNHVPAAKVASLRLPDITTQDAANLSQLISGGLTAIAGLPTH